ncbi:MAG: hypothetical protein JWL96_4668, partial [Sphingomonas bacterium]|nr:hypothetical protein [Sphingomonas bacterium]
MCNTASASSAGSRAQGDASTATDEVPHAGRARSRAAGELRDAPALGDAGARWRKKHSSVRVDDPSGRRLLRRPKALARAFTAHGCSSPHDSLDHPGQHEGDDQGPDALGPPRLGFRTFARAGSTARRWRVSTRLARAPRTGIATRRRSRTRNDEAHQAQALRVHREARDAAATQRAVRHARLDRQGEGLSRSSHPGRARGVLRLRARAFRCIHMQYASNRSSHLAPRPAAGENAGPPSRLHVPPRTSRSLRCALLVVRARPALRQNARGARRTAHRVGARHAAELLRRRHRQALAVCRAAVGVG